MKKIFSSKAAGALALCLLAAGCNKFDDDINTNPNEPSVASGTQLLAYAMQQLPETRSSASGVLYAQQLSEAEYITLSRYQTIHYSFYSFYADPLMNLEEVLTSENLDAIEGPVANQLAVAKILKAYFYWHMTDRWGDIPYTDALKGADNFTPSYDTQESIYHALFALLDEANAEIVSEAIDNDIIYGGDMEKWRRLANTIHMLMALRLSIADPALGKEEFNKALNAGVMKSNGDNFTFQHLSDENNWNYWYDVFEDQNREWYAISEPLAGYMKATSDPRLPTFANKNEAGQYVGLKYGLPEGEVNTGPYEKKNISMLGSPVRQANSPAYLVTYAQALFAQAEAAKRGWIPGGDAVAEENYALAVEQSVRQWNNDDISGLAAMMSDPQVAYSPASALEQIGYQRWVHLFLHGYEAWAEWRRTGYPELSPPEGAGGLSIPRREGYPTEESKINAANYNEAVGRAPLNGTDDLNGRVWWDTP